MSGQRSRKLGSPSSSSARGFGPLRATKTFGPGSPSLPVSPSTPLTLSSSSSSSSSYDPGKRRSVSSTVWTEKLISPNYFGFTKDKKLIRSPVETIRRSSSYDTIGSSYLCGEWPRSNHPLIHLNLIRCCPAVLTADKWTQTLDDMDEKDIAGSIPQQQQQNQRRPDLSSVDSGYGCGGFREIRPRLLCPSARVSPPPLLACSGCGSPAASPASAPGICGGDPAAVPRSKAIAIPAANRRNPLALCQGSAEGFNQEIEKLVHSTGASDGYLDLSKSRALTPDGHRAPIADLLNIRSVNTQTPSSGGGLHNSGIEQHFLRVLEDSDDSPSLPIIPGAGETSLLFYRPTSADSDTSDPCERVIGGSVSSSSFIPLKTSEKRETPEGCERIEVEFSKTSEVPVRRDICHDLQSPIETNSLLKCLIPSERSAFCPLLKKYVSQQTILSFSLSANESDSGSIEAK